MKIDWQWPAAAVYCITFAALSGLIFDGKMHPEALLAMLTWLAPSPYQPKPPTVEP